MERVVYKDKVKEVIKVVEKEVEVKQKRKPLIAVVIGSVWFLSCVWCLGTGMSAGEKVEVLKEVKVEVPVEWFE